MARLTTVLLAGLLSCACTAEGEEPTQPQQRTDSAVVDSARPDTRVDTRTEDDTSVTDSPAPADAPAETSPPPPIEDTSMIDDYGVPAPGTHVEKLIGPEGGELAGAAGTALDSVRLVVPKGALGTTILFALDYAGPVVGPDGAPGVSPLIRVGPDGVPFAIPARITLPWKASGSAQIGMLARIGLSWGALLDPTGDATTVTGSMRRTSGVAAVLVTNAAPSIASRSDAGVGGTVFVEGTDFGIAQAFAPLADGGSVVSNVTYGGVISETLAWSDTSLAIKVPAGADGGAIRVTTPGGVASSP